MRADNLAAFLPILFDKHHMPPRGRAKVTGVVVRISRPGEPVVWYVVPFFTCHLAGLAADAHGRIGEESNLNVVAHVRMPTLIRTVCAFSDHENQIRKAGTQENTAQECRFIWANNNAKFFPF